MIAVCINGRFLTQPVTGVQRYALETVRALDALLERRHPIAQRFRFTLVTPRAGARDPGFKHVPVERMGRLHGHAWEQLELPRRANGSLLLSLGNASPVRVRWQVVTIHDASVFALPDAYARSFGVWYRTMLRALGRRATLVVTDSRFSRDELARYRAVPAVKTRVVYPGGEHVTAVEADRGVLLRHGLGSRRFVLAVGSASRHKNLRGVLEAVSSITGRDFDLVIVGGANPRVFGHAGPTTGADIRKLGYVSDAELRALYEEAACLVYPSFYEGFGLPPIEAMTLGCPVVVSRAGALVEVCGSAALYCDAQDPRDIGTQITRVLTDSTLEAGLRTRGRERARAFSWRNCAERMLDVLEEAAMSGRSRTA